MSTSNAPIFGSSSFTLTLEHITDSRGLLGAEMGIFPFSDLLIDPTSPFHLYEYTTTAVPDPSGVQCDISKTTPDICLESVSITFDSQLVRSTTSVPGISQLDIWLNAGAIVGGVQFFAWLLGLPGT